IGTGNHYCPPGCRGNLSRSPADRSTVDSSAFAQGHGETKPAISPHTRFVARQPILTKEEKVFGYVAGFVYFQGYFFRRPELMTAREIPANRLNYLRMLQAVSQPELDPKEIENVVKSEASICYRLLRYLNSAVFGFPSEIHSVRHALSILGEREVRRWVRLVATLGAGQGKSSELVLSALVRARFCELLAPKVPQGSSTCFSWGCSR